MLGQVRLPPDRLEERERWSYVHSFPMGPVFIETAGKMHGGRNSKSLGDEEICDSDSGVAV